MRFENLGQIVQFAQKTTLKVEVEPVPGEENTDNNSASYPVIFTLDPAVAEAFRAFGLS